MYVTDNFNVYSSKYAIVPSCEQLQYIPTPVCPGSGQIEFPEFCNMMSAKEGSIRIDDAVWLLNIGMVLVCFQGNRT